MYNRVFSSVANLTQTFNLFKRLSDAPFDEIRLSGERIVGSWFEVNDEVYQYFLEILHPIIYQSDYYVMSEAQTGSIYSVFMKITTSNDKRRYFHAYCDLTRQEGLPPDHFAHSLRAAIKNRIDAPDANIPNRSEKLEAIWDTTPADYRNYAGSANPDAWPVTDIGKRTILIATNNGTALTLLDSLSDNDIELKYKPGYQEEILNRPSDY